MIRGVVLFVTVVCSSQSAAAQIPRRCSDTAKAEAQRPEIMRYFTEGGQYAFIREGRWPQLAPNVTSKVVTRVQDCRAVVDVVNARIAQQFSSSSVFRTETLVHLLYEIGPYYVIVFLPDGLVGLAPMWILDKSTLAFLWAQGV